MLKPLWFLLLPRPLFLALGLHQCVQVQDVSKTCSNSVISPQDLIEGETLADQQIDPHRGAPARAK